MFLNSSLTSSNVISFPPALRHDLPCFACPHTTNGWVSFRAPILKLNCLQLVSRGPEHPLSLPTLPVASASWGQGHPSWYLPGGALLSFSGLRLTTAAAGAWLEVCIPPELGYVHRETLFQSASSLQNGAKYYLLSASSA